MSRRVESRGPSVVTIGAFDGIHLGHRKILEEVTLLSHGIGATGVVVTFTPHPISMLQPGAELQLLTPLEEKLSLIESLGVDHTVLLRFTSKFARQSAESFLRDTLIGSLKMQRLVIGYDFRFGKGREGDASCLESLGQTMGFGVDIIPPVKFLGHPISSTRVRNALARGEVDIASRMLGREYSLSGRVVRGEGRGRGLSYPTANLEVTDSGKMVPADGVYAVRVRMGGKTSPGVAYIGTKPTFGSRPRVVEVHLLDSEVCLYGTDMEVLLINRIRGERKFKDQTGLRAAIGRDVKQAKRMLLI